MQITKRRSRIIAVTLAALGAANPTYAYDVYHGLRTVGTTGSVDWTHVSFGVSGTPSNLSFSHYATDDLARAGMPTWSCLLKVDLGALPADVAVNSEVAIGVAPQTVDAARAFPWTIVFDNNPAGHWSIARDRISSLQPPTNTAASRVAAAFFSNLANRKVTVVNGSRGDCTP